MSQRPQPKDVAGQKQEQGTSPASGIVEAMRVCPNCSTELQEVRCKLSCPRCGFFLSCSDYYWSGVIAAAWNCILDSDLWANTGESGGDRFLSFPCLGRSRSTTMSGRPRHARLFSFFL